MVGAFQDDVERTRFAFATSSCRAGELSDDVASAESESILKNWKKAAEVSAETGRALVSEHVVGVNKGAIGNKAGLEEWSEDEIAKLARSDAFRTIARLRGWI